MKIILFINVYLFAFILTHSSAQAQDCQNPIGEWENQSGSILAIDSIGPSGLIHGQYLSHEGTEGQAFSVTGWWNLGDTLAEKSVVSFTVHWKPYNTITSWTGYCITAKDEIHTLWHHIDTDTNFEFQEWSTQASIFKAVNP